MGLNEDILIGASCGDYVHGGGRCCNDNDCNGNGICIQGQCMCKSGYVCDHCSALAIDIVNGSMKKKRIHKIQKQVVLVIILIVVNMVCVKEENVFVIQVIKGNIVQLM